MLAQGSSYILDFGQAIFLVGIVSFCGIIAFLIFGLPLVGKIGSKASGLFWPDDGDFRVLPEYSVAEARVNEGKYHEAIEEYRKVIATHPDDIHAHLRIADVLLKHLDDAKTAESELLTAFAKVSGADSTSLVAGRLADLYQHTLHDLARALAVMKQLREKIPDTKQAKLAEERITALEGVLHGVPQPPRVPDKISPRRSRYRMTE